MQKAGSCTPGALCPVTVTVHVRPAATTRAVTWKVGAARSCRSGITWSPPTSVTAQPGWTTVYASSSVPVPRGRSLALVALTTAPGPGPVPTGAGHRIVSGAASAAMLSVERGLRGGRRSRPGPGRPAQLPVAALLDPLAVGAVVILAGLGLANLAALGDRSVSGTSSSSTSAAWCCSWSCGAGAPTACAGWAGAATPLSVLLLMAVDLGGSTVRGAQRWIAFGSFTMQPSELAKLGLLLVLAQVLGSDRPWPRRLVTALVVAALPIGLVLTQPDLSTAAVLCAVTGTMLVLGRIPLKVLVPVLVTAVLVLPFAEHLLHPYQQERLHAFLSGSTDANGPGWAILQMHIALAWGGLTGGAWHPLHQLVGLYLPDRETDLAFASLVEQYGILAGSLAVARRGGTRLAGRAAPAAAPGAVPRPWPRPASRRWSASRSRSRWRATSAWSRPRACPSRCSATGGRRPPCTSPRSGWCWRSAPTGRRTASGSAVGWTPYGPGCCARPRSRSPAP